VEFEFSILSVVCYLGLLLGVSNVVGVVCGCVELYDCGPMLHLVGILFPHINDDAWSKSHQIQFRVYFFIRNFEFFP